MSGHVFCPKGVAKLYLKWKICLVVSVFEYHVATVEILSLDADCCQKENVWVFSQSRLLVQILEK
jgi:hypothetical protein